jgi:hypothetical protein
MIPNDDDDYIPGDACNDDDDYIPDDAHIDDIELEQAAYDAWLDDLLHKEALDEAAYDAYLDYLAREEYIPEGIEEIAAELNREQEAEDLRRSTETAKPPSEQKEVDEDEQTEGTDPCGSNP